MDGKRIGVLFGIVLLFSLGSLLVMIPRNKIKEFSGRVEAQYDDYFVVSNQNDEYKFSYLDDEVIDQSDIKIKYRGNLKKNKINQCESYSMIQETVSIIDELEANGIFSAYYSLAKNKLDEMSLDEKIGQLLLVRVPDSNAVEAVKKYQFGGYLLFEKDFKDKNSKQINHEIQSYQDVSKIPMLIATDEEGGKVVRASSNSQLIDSPFSSSQELYQKGGFDLIREDTLKKSKFLESLGVNVNLAPIVDVVTDTNAYMYQRSFGKDTKLTSEYAETVIKASKEENVSYVLKHFPGYGNSGDTHNAVVSDDRPLDEIMDKDIPPFQAGIDALAEAVLVSHKIMDRIEEDTVASLSKDVHQLLRDDLGFSGVIISDDIDMLSTKTNDISELYHRAIAAGNDLLIVTDYETAFQDIKSSVENGTLDANTVDKAALRVLAWKYYKILFPVK